MEIEFTYWMPQYGSENSFIYILTIILFLLAIISYLQNKMDILNPSFIFSICLASCCGLAALYTKKWNLPMHFNTAMIIIIMAISFILGSSVAKYCTFFISKDKKFTNKDSFQTVQELQFSLPWLIWLGLGSAMVFFAYISYCEFIEMASRVTEERQFSKMIYPVLDGLAHGTITWGRWNVYRMCIANCIAYLSLFGMWVNLFKHQYNEFIKWSILLILYIPLLILTGGRQLFLYLTLFGMISLFLLYRKNNNGRINFRKEFLIAFFTLTLFLCLFVGVGILNEKIGTDTKLLKVLVHYTGTNISAFDVWLNEITIPDTVYIGTTTLSHIYGMLYRHGFGVPYFFQYNTLFTYMGPVTTNVYTAFSRYIQDYGYLGSIIVVFLLGYSYTYFYRWILLKGLKPWMILVYAAIAYPLFLMGREERFLNEIISTSNIRFLICLLALYKGIEYLNRRKDELK